MEDKNYYISSDTMESGADECTVVAEESAEMDKPQKNKHLSNNQVIVASICIIALLIIATVYLLLDAVKIGAIAANDKYQSQKQIVSNQVKDKFHDIGAAQHHVSNRISISLGNIREQMKLEVLRVSEVDYQTKDDAKTLLQMLSGKLSDLFGPNIVSWLEVPGYGVFTVDLQSAEFIIDEARQYVLIRVPFPELSDFTIDYKNVVSLNFEDSGIFKGSAAVGEDLAREQLQNAELTMLQKVKGNQDFYKSACNSAETILKALVLELNPKIPDLAVEVEFM